MKSTLLKFATHLELPECSIHLHPREIHLLCEAVQDGHVERVHQVAEVLADHVLRQALPRDQEPRDGLGRVLEEAPSDEVRDAFVRLLVEDVESGAVVSLPDDLVHGVAVTHLGWGRASRNSVRLEPGQADVDVAGVAVAGRRKVGGDV